MEVGEEAVVGAERQAFTGQAEEAVFHRSGVLS
jgi:hypothetical protein